MAIIRCKMCGGDLNILEGASTAECEFCGTVQTIPNLDDEKKLIQFERAERLRKQCEFDKAAGIYETIVADFRQEAEAYWGLVLCKYGIEYVDDPATGKKIPTCHRSGFDSVMKDPNVELAQEYADIMARRLYREEAKAIEEIRKGIIAVSANEEPYDVFICYKETDFNGKRTLDSVLAQDIYDALTDKGYRVFFSRISLEDKLGTEYEPYIFAALNSAKIMLAIGTDFEYFNAVWVKNEWSRFLKLMAQDKSKHLIPCYKGIDAYDMPEEFAKLQAQDLDKMGAIQDIVRGVQKLLPKQEQTVKETVVVQQTSGNNPSIDSYLERVFMFLEDGDWNSANEYCEKVLDIDPKNARAYLGKLMAELKVKKQASLKDCAEPFDGKNSYQKALRFADDGLKKSLTEAIAHIKTRNENARLEGIYSKAKNLMAQKTENGYSEAANAFSTISQYKDASALEKECQENRLELIYSRAKDLMAQKTENGYSEAANLFATISRYKDAAALEKECREKAAIVRKDTVLDDGLIQLKNAKSISGYKKAIKLFSLISGWKNADEKIALCNERIKELEAKRNKKIITISTAVVVVLAALIVIWQTVLVPMWAYDDAVALMNDGKYDEAIAAFEELEDYKDSKQMIPKCEYDHAVSLMSEGKYDEAIAAFEKMDGYKDSLEKIDACHIAIRDANYDSAVFLMNDGKYDEAIAAFEELDGYKDSAEMIMQCRYGYAEVLEFKERYAEAVIAFAHLEDYQDAKARSEALWEKIAVRDAIGADSSHTVGLKEDGTVMAVGYNDGGQCNVTGWQDIVAISAGFSHTVGLKTNGSVVAVGYNVHGKCDVAGWRDIVAISAGAEHTVGLKADGTAVAVGRNVHGQCKVDHWTDIVAISAGGSHSVGLKADGTVVAVGDNEYGQCNVTGWQDIVAISAGGGYTVGLKADGTVLAVGYNMYGQCNVGGWRDIVAISAGSNHTIGLKADGTVVAVGANYHGQCDVDDWKNIRVPEKD